MIRKAEKKDFEDYLRLKRQEEKEYSKITGKKITYPKDNIIRKEYIKSLSSNKHSILFKEVNNEIMGYLHGTYFSNPFNKGGFIEDLFVLKDFRRNGVAKDLVIFFINILKKKNYKKIQLSVSPKNQGAIRLYEKLGFKVFHWDLRKEWK